MKGTKLEASNMAVPQMTFGGRSIHDSGGKGGDTSVVWIHLRPT